MATIQQVIQRLLPGGTRPSPLAEPALVDWRVPPAWPPDVFAVAATLVNLSGAYAHADIMHERARAPSTKTWAERIHFLGQAWAELRTDDFLVRLGELWSEILAASHESVSDRVDTVLPPWCVAAFELMAISDEASAGIGFGRGNTPMTAGLVARHFAGDATENIRATATICQLVPPEECCVQPKGRTPQVGCTLRSLSHHLALLPPIGEVTTSYFVNPRPLTGRELNLLLIPFPYCLDLADIRAGKKYPDEHWAKFRVKQGWLPKGPPQVAASQLARLILRLVEEARKISGRRVHGVVLPEFVLSRELALRVAQSLARTEALDLFIAGTADTTGGLTRNYAMAHLFRDGEAIGWWEQGKHHRWRLERTQIDSYGLAMDRELLWWEDIDVKNRHMRFYGFHEGAILATLVCEDLARVDPVQPVLRAVGPNLVIALLMDGPQLKSRWPSRYATVLAEDPGSSVLTLTSLALLDHSIRQWRKSHPTDDSRRVIGLWKDSTGRTEEIALHDGSLAVLLGLKLNDVEEWTMDRRSDGAGTVEIAFNETWQVTLKRKPAWLTAPPPLATL